MIKSKNYDTINLLKVTEEKMNEKAMELLKVFELDDKADFLASNLPYGEQRNKEKDTDCVCSSFFRTGV